MGAEVEAWRIWLLGGFKVSIWSRTIEKHAWYLRKAAALIKLLSLAEGRRLHREQVMDLLWPELEKKPPQTTCVEPSMPPVEHSIRTEALFT